MEQTTQAVACRWCHKPGVEICPTTCQGAETVAIRCLKAWGKLTPETLREAMEKYLATRPEPFTTCPRPECGAEQWGPTFVCWACGYDGRIGNG